MKTKSEVVEELIKRIHSGELEPSVEDILLEDEKRLLVGRMSAEKIATETFISTRYEIWSDKDKFKEGIPGEGNYIYCAGYAGLSEEAMIALFQSYDRCE